MSGCGKRRKQPNPTKVVSNEKPVKIIKVFFKIGESQKPSHLLVNLVLTPPLLQFLIDFVKTLLIQKDSTFFQQTKTIEETVHSSRIKKMEPSESATTTKTMMKRESESIATQTDDFRSKKDMKKFFCAICQAKFLTSDELVSHVKTDCIQPPTAIMSATTKCQSSYLPSLAGPSNTLLEDNKHTREDEQPRVNGVSAKPTPKFDANRLSLDLSAKLSAPILLPVAVHDEDSVKVLGPPQYVIPVAVNRNAIVPPSNLVIHSQLCNNVDLPDKIHIANGLPNYFLNLAAEMTANPVPAAAPGPAPIIPPPLKRKLEEPIPLDLSVKIPRITPNPPLPNVQKLDFVENFSKIVNNPFFSILNLPSVSMISNPPLIPPTQPLIKKKFKCDCGIEFIDETTFKGHKNHYCSLRPQTDAEKCPTIKVPESCPHCDFRPYSNSQLHQHIKQFHNSGKCYVCHICQYRGFSLRGIRSHLKEHLDPKGTIGADLEAISNMCFTEISTNAKILPNESSVDYPKIS